ncbi:MAG TPA: TonB-dependent receptor [Pyrinomonadaceae bacterium]|nr:TonB-dependent receptor [Pyrinomonadaceae bacterium]
MPRFPNVCSSAFHHLRKASAIRKFPLYRCLPVCLLFVSFLTNVHAQSSTATLSGIVIDQTGAVIPGVKIAVISIAQGFQRNATTNDEGIFIVGQLPPGSYTVKAEHDGFTPAEVRDVILNVNDQKTIKVYLKVGNVSQTVEIVDGSSLIDDSAAVGTVVDRRFVSNLPLNGRSFQSLIALTPGVVLTKASADNPGQFSVNGQRGNANYFMVDGVGANISVTRNINVSQTLGGSLPGLTAQGGTNSLVSVDALQEFKVLTSTYAPEFGRSPGGQISIITRSGTNDFHGTLFDYFRNDVFDANDWFANATRQPKPKERQNDFGGVLGGPVLLPRFGEGGRQPWYDGHNRTFFFFSYEGLRLRQPQVVANSEVPSLSLRQTAVARMQPFLNAFPIPNGADLGNGLAHFSASFSNPSRLDATSIRIDHTVNEKLSFFARYNDSPSQVITRGTGTGLSSPTTANVNTKTLTGSMTFVLNAQTTNDLRANYSRVLGETHNTPDSFGGAVPLTASQVLPPFADPANSFFALLVNFSPTVSIGKTASSLQRQVNIVDTFSTVTSTHHLKFGVDYRRLTPIFGPAAYTLVAFFNNANAARTGTASSLSIAARQPAHLLFTNFSAFGQDTWKVNRRLTLTYGLRWELNPPPEGADGNDAFTAVGLDNPATITLAPRGTPLYKTTYDNFAPRFGLAYQLVQTPGRELVMRGGVGIFYDLGSGQAAQGFAAAPYSTGNKTPAPANVPFPATGPVVAPPPTPVPPFSVVNAIDPNLELPRTYQWNFALEQALGSNQTFSASYVAAVGRRLVSVQALQNPNPTFAFVNIIKNRATSDYHAFEAQFQRRLARGVQALASYTWGHSIDLISSDFGFDLDRGPSDFDVRHSFSSAVSYDIPTPALGQFGRAMLSNWALDAIVHSQTATPVNVIARPTLALSGEVINFRPDLIEGIPLYLEDPNAPGGWRFNNTVDPSRPGCKGPFCPPPTNRQGTLGRNALRSFPLNQIDLSVRRQFNLKEGVSLLFRTDIFNIFNHPNFGDPNNRLTQATFGQATTMFGRGLAVGSAGLSPLYQIGGPRSMQFSLKLQF